MDLRNYKITYKCLRYIIIIFAVLCLSLMFHVRMTDDMDFARHQTLLNDIRKSNIGFWEYVLYNPLGVSGNITYAFTYSFNILCYIVAKLFENNYVLVWISALIEYGIIAYIAYDWKRDSEYTLIQILFSILLCFAVYPVIHAFSGIRTSLAASFMALAVYLFLCKDCSIIKYIILCIVSVTFHPVMLMAVPITVAIKISSKLTTIILIMIFAILFNHIVVLFEQLNIPFLSAMVTKYLTYTSAGQFRAWRFCLYGVILICFICIVYYIFIIQIKSKETDGKEKLYAFLICFMGLILGNIGGYETVMRPSYLLGALAPIIVSMLTEQNALDQRLNARDPVKGVIKIGAAEAVFALSVYMGIMYISYFGSYFV